MIFFFFLWLIKGNEKEWRVWRQMYEVSISILSSPYYITVTLALSSMPALAISLIIWPVHSVLLQHSYKAGSIRAFMLFLPSFDTTIQILQQKLRVIRAGNVSPI